MTRRPNKFYATHERTPDGGRKPVPLYKRYRDMLERCERRSHTSYVWYGARGIAVCEEWRSFEMFADWATKNGFSPDLQLDRINNDAGYSPDNCRWATPKENSANKRNTRLIDFPGHGLITVSEFARRIGVHVHTALSWARKDASAASILTMAANHLDRRRDK